MVHSESLIENQLSIIYWTDLVSYVKLSKSTFLTLLLCFVNKVMYACVWKLKIIWYENLDLILIDVWKKAGNKNWNIGFVTTSLPSTILYNA